MNPKSLEWPIATVRREAAKAGTVMAIPDNCPKCHSKQIFVGSGNLKCFHCNVSLSLTEANTTDEGLRDGTKAEEDQREALKDGHRKALEE